MNARPVVLTAGAVAPTANDGVVSDAAVLSEIDCRAVPVVTSFLGHAPGRRFAEPVPAALLERQIAAAFAGPRPEGALIGLVLDAEQVRAIAAAIDRAVPDVAVYAPVVSIHGETLLDAATLAAAEAELFGRVRVVVLRANDAEHVTGIAVEGFDALKAAAGVLRRRGARAAIVAGYQAHGRVADVVDDGGTITLLDAARIQASHVAGLAGAYATAVAGHLAHGATPARAAGAAQRYVAMRLMRGR
ncbi:MAG TPA: bifunctional hydroxymethylpyrimidine kinase/phosphomethylpyrimidine kinase [Candidatus Polarisedimenticolaceae bacterium]|nr:bifunctional hydroxymethylpyrimidine kinase/phosphomethylpyrimidine kinase [Candidatus Polarisedimenticolaceae bacterium]